MVIIIIYTFHSLYPPGLPPLSELIQLKSVPGTRYSGHSETIVNIINL